MTHTNTYTKGDEDYDPKKKKKAKTADETVRFVFAISTQLTEQCSHKNTQIRRQKKNANSAKMSLSR